MTSSALPKDASEISLRLNSRLSKWELAAILASSLVAIYLCILVAQKSFFPVDYFTYRSAALGDYHDYFYAFWILPVFRLLSFLPDVLQVFIFYFLSIFSVWFAVRVFAGKAPIVIFSYNMLWILWFGQLSGIVVGGLALMQWGITTRRWWIAGIGMIIASTKYHTGIPIVLTLWLLADISWKDRFRILIIPVSVAILSLALYGFWPLDILSRAATDNPPNGATSYTLWRWIGPVALVFWIPVLLLPLSRGRRLIAVVACMAMSFPYFQLSDLLYLLVLPNGWLPLLGDISFLHIVYNPILQLTVLIPLAAYIRVIWPSMMEWLYTIRTPQKT